MERNSTGLVKYQFNISCFQKQGSGIDTIKYHTCHRILSDFINLTQVHNFTVSAQDIFTSRRLSVFTVSFTRILQVVMQIMKDFRCTTD